MIPARPVYVKQLDGSRYAGLNCTCAAGAMALDRHTIGQTRTTGAYVRALTGDTTGGTNLSQVAAAIARRWGVQLDVHYGIAWASFDDELHAGHGAILQGSSAATIGTRYRASETFRGNHAWYVNGGRGWTQGTSGTWHPTDYLVYDPLADGRRAGIAQSPMWIPASIVHRFAALLNTSGDNLLGAGRAYCAFTKDTEPHVHLRYNGKRTTPFPDRTKAYNAVASRRVNVRATPTLTGDVVSRLHVGDLFTAYQLTDTGTLVAGSRRWYGDHNGRRWVHSSGLHGEGGTS